MRDLEGALREATAFAADRRVHRCELEVCASTDGSVELSGTVLDVATRDRVVAELGPRVVASAVRVLRPGERRFVRVAVADLHSDPGHATPVLTQILVGDEIERLEERAGWSLVRLEDGYLGWIAPGYVTAAAAVPATHRVVGSFAVLRAAPAPNARVVGRLAIGTRVHVQAASAEWVELDIEGHRGAHVEQSAVAPLGRSPNPSDTITETALELVGVPYLWGGITAFGIDCSGLTRLCHALGGIEIPRDADWQHAAARPVTPPFEAGDLLFFGEAGGHRAISHVGVSLGQGRVVHASRTHAGVAVDDLDAAPWLSSAFIAAGSFCR